LEAQISESSLNFVPNKAMYEPNMSNKIEDQDPLLVYAATADPDTMYLHEVMQQQDKAKFMTAMKDEVLASDQSNNWQLVHRSKVPQGTPILPAIWQMKRKRRIATWEVYKWKAPLNIEGSKLVKGVDCWDTYAPVMSWPTVRLLLIIAVVQGWHTKQLNFVLAYTQAPAESDNLYMRVPKGWFDVPGASPNKASR
jgi:hypothetical protein